VSFTIAGTGTQSHVPFEVKVATASEAQEALGHTREVCPSAAVYESTGREVDDTELELLAGLERAIAGDRASLKDRCSPSP
jgi:hypothetical protein